MYFCVFKFEYLKEIVTTFKMPSYSDESPIKGSSSCPFTRFVLLSEGYNLLYFILEACFRDMSLKDVLSLSEFYNSMYFLRDSPFK